MVNSNPPRMPRWLRLGAVALVAMGVVVTTGCSGAPSSGPTTSNAPKAGSAASAGADASGASTAASSAAPAPGSTASTLPPRAQPVNKPTKRLTGTASSVAPRLTAELSSMRTRRVNSKVPGEVSGDAVVFQVTVRNGTAKTVDLSNVVVNVEGADGAPASQVTSSPAKAPPPRVGAGRTASGTYAFLVPKGERNPITVSVTLSAQTKVALFKGSVA